MGRADGENSSPVRGFRAIWDEKLNSQSTGITPAPTVPKWTPSKTGSKRPNGPDPYKHSFDTIQALKSPPTTKRFPKQRLSPKNPPAAPHFAKRQRGPAWNNAALVHGNAHNWTAW